MNQRLIKACLFLVAHLCLAHASAGETIHALAPDSFKQIVSQHVGKPLVILVWGLDCEYCQASFNALAAARRKHDFAVVTIATDRVDDPQARGLIRKKLEASGLGANMWAFGSAPMEQLRYSIDPKWRGEMPRSYWYSARGEAVAYSGVITSETVRKLLPN
jgi:thiol-disulfide isomerase/thioredoxin